MKSRKPLQSLVALGLFASAGAAIAAQPLFVGELTPTAKSRAALQSIAARPDSSGLRALRANPAVVSASTQEIQLDLGMRRVTAVLENAEAVGEGGLVWSGRIKETAKSRPGSLREVASDAANSAILVRRGNGVTGNVRVDGKLYRIRPLPEGGHAVVEVDESRMPKDHPAEYDALPKIRMAGGDSGMVGTMGSSSGTAQTIRVMVVATANAINGYGGDMRALVDLAVAESNQSYKNSNVGITLQLAGYYTTTYNSVGMSTDLSRFRGTSDGYMDGVHSTRNSVAADVMMLVVNDSSSCGLASGIGSSASTAFAAVYWNCATGYYSFAHEIGHLQSARHDPAADPSTTPYAYGHGYQAPNKAWRTIMSYNCSPSCPRINYWSNPNKTYGGVAMGTSTKNDNQRVLVNTKATIAGFR
ncbi:M12 family metallo-peptidase [Cognatilysobacter bugurensis]|uniref:Peptidyl-Asp metalloendopeptidase n=1 Tax=Cognatilysobacter bugurensis TaxID=543356 RepID=A0A918WBV8_9GAMM|nr:M12 family metallo-peptidase [Lysobacter bugurensis]GHA89594.1 peptidyl-Asp metalloendopeptidase [Lysobacter bugurensis]